MALLGTNARDLPMHEGMLLGGIVAGGACKLMITLMKAHRADPFPAGPFDP
jgi:hypothetical protein